MIKKLTINKKLIEDPKVNRFQVPTFYMNFTILITLFSHGSCLLYTNGFLNSIFGTRKLSSE